MKNFGTLTEIQLQKLREKLELKNLIVQLNHPRLPADGADGSQNDPPEAKQK